MNKETEFHQISQMEVEYPSEQEIKQQREYTTINYRKAIILAF